MSLRYVDLEATDSKKQNKSQYQFKYNFYSYSNNNDSQKLSPVYSSRNSLEQTNRKAAERRRIDLNAMLSKSKTIALVMLLFILVSLCIGYLLETVN